jgi:hypothetical protein
VLKASDRKAAVEKILEEMTSWTTEERRRTTDD